MQQFADLIGGPLGPYIITAAGWAVVLWGSRHFPTRKEFDGLGERVTGVQTISQGAVEVADRALERVGRVEEVQSERHTRMVETMERVSRAMERIAEEQQEIQRQQSTTAAEQGALSRDVARLFKKLDG